MLETLCAASEEQCTVRAVYYVESRREQTSREIDPYHVHWDPRLEALYVFGWCHLRRDVRTFAVHRGHAERPSRVIPAQPATKHSGVDYKRRLPRNRRPLPGS